MMKWIAAILIAAVGALVAGLYLPWWSIVIGPVLSVFIANPKNGMAFLASFLGVFICWALLAAFINNANEGLLASKMGVLLGLGAKPFLLIIITAFIGGLVAGMAGLTANLLRTMMVKSDASGE